jgi:hypothetical protein
LGKRSALFGKGRTGSVAECDSGCVRRGEFMFEVMALLCLALDRRTLRGEFMFEVMSLLRLALEMFPSASFRRLRCLARVALGE